MEIKEAITYLRPIADSSHLKQYSAALDTAIRCMEEVEALRRELIDERDRFDRLTDFELAEALVLQDYKRTGLTPEEIKELEADWCVANQLVQEYKAIGRVERALELLQAEQDGRLVVLPCGTDVELERDGHTFKADHWNHSLTAFRDTPETKSGKQIALFSIEEAKAALAGKGGKE